MNMTPQTEWQQIQATRRHLEGVQLATPGMRVQAKLVNDFIVSGSSIVFYLLFLWVLIKSASQNGGVTPGFLGLILGVAYICWFIWIIYTPGWQGHYVGSHRAPMRIVDVETGKPAKWKFIGRQMVRAFAASLTMGLSEIYTYISMQGGKSRSWADKIANVAVIDTRTVGLVNNIAGNAGPGQQKPASTAPTQGGPTSTVTGAQVNPQDVVDQTVVRDDSLAASPGPAAASSQSISVPPPNPSAAPSVPGQQPPAPQPAPSPVPAASTPQTSAPPAATPAASPVAPPDGMITSSPFSSSPATTNQNAGQAGMEAMNEDEAMGATVAAGGMTQEPVAVASEATLVVPVNITLSTGTEHRIDGVAIVGRAPKAHPDYPGAQLIALSDQGGSVSESHFACGVDSAGFWAKDLNSTNGLRLRQADGSWRPLPTNDVIRLQLDSLVQCGDHSWIVRATG